MKKRVIENQKNFNLGLIENLQYSFDRNEKNIDFVLFEVKFQYILANLDFFINQKEKSIDSNQLIDMLKNIKLDGQVFKYASEEIKESINDLLNKYDLKEEIRKLDDNVNNFFKNHFLDMGNLRSDTGTSIECLMAIAYDKSYDSYNLSKTFNLKNLNLDYLNHLKDVKTVYIAGPMVFNVNYKENIKDIITKFYSLNKIPIFPGETKSLITELIDEISNSELKKFFQKVNDENERIINQNFDTSVFATGNSTEIAYAIKDINRKLATYLTDFNLANLSLYHTKKIDKFPFEKPTESIFNRSYNDESIFVETDLGIMMYQKYENTYTFVENFNQGFNLMMISPEGRDSFKMSPLEEAILNKNKEQIKEITGKEVLTLNEFLNKDNKLSSYTYDI